MLCSERDYILARIQHVLLWNGCLADIECHLLIHQPAFPVTPTDQEGWTLSSKQAEQGKQTSCCPESQRRLMHTLNAVEERLVGRVEINSLGGPMWKSKEARDYEMTRGKQTKGFERKV